ncbi:MAG: ABC transporter permease [Candidatus Binatia bacterium]
MSSNLIHVAAGVPRWSTGIWQAIKTNSFSFGIALLLLWVVGAPIVTLLVSSLREGSFISPGPFTLSHYKTVYFSSQTYPALVNTLIYAVTVSAISLMLATMFAWLVERTDMPGQNWAWVMMLLPLAMPGILRSMAWILLLSPKTGIINIWLRFLLGIFDVEVTEGPLDIFTLPGMIFVEAMSGTTTLFLLMVGAFRLMDPSMEEAARVSGASSLTTLRKVTLGLMKPAVLAAAMYAFLGNLDDFEVPLLIGLQAGIYLLPTLIYFTAYMSPSYGMASAYSSIFIIFTVAMVWIYFKLIIKQSDRYASITGKGYRPRRISLGRWRWLGLGCFYLFFFVNILLPFFTLVWASLLPTYMAPSWSAFQYLTVENYITLTRQPLIVTSAINTLLLGLISATATMGLAYLVSWLIVRLKVKAGVFLDAAAFIPHAIPTVAIGLALITFYLHPAVNWIPIYGTMWIMMLALMTRYLAFATRTSNSAMIQLNRELEEAARASGASRFITLVKITFPLLLPPFIGGWIWVFAHTLRSFTIPLLLASPGNETVSVIMYQFWDRKSDFALASTLGVAMLLVMGLVTFFARRSIARGFTRDQ